jgi:hypothetical protein
MSPATPVLVTFHEHTMNGPGTQPRGYGGIEPNPESPRSVLASRAIDTLLGISSRHVYLIARLIIRHSPALQRSRVFLT